MHKKHLKCTMRNRIRKHCNAINAKGGEVNNKFKHSLVTNRPEALLDHARVASDKSCYQGGIEIWAIDIIAVQRISVSGFSAATRDKLVFLLTRRLVHRRTFLLEVKSHTKDTDIVPWNI